MPEVVGSSSGLHCLCGSRRHSGSWGLRRGAKGEADDATGTHMGTHRDNRKQCQFPYTVETASKFRCSGTGFRSSACEICKLCGSGRGRGEQVPAQRAPSQQQDGKPAKCTPMRFRNWGPGFPGGGEGASQQLPGRRGGSFRQLPRRKGGSLLAASQEEGRELTSSFPGGGEGASQQLPRRRGH